MFQRKDCKYCNFYAYFNVCIYNSFHRAHSVAINFFRFNVCLWIALVIAVCTVLLTLILFIPNTILVALKYRSGLLPSLRSEGFMIYRKNMTSITFLIPGGFRSVQHCTVLQMDFPLTHFSFCSSTKSCFGLQLRWQQLSLLCFLC